MGAKWQRIRSILNPRMLKPKHVQSYTNTINEVVTDFVDRVDWMRETNGQGVMVNDLAGELYKFAFEGQQRNERVEFPQWAAFVLQISITYTFKKKQKTNYSNHTATRSILVHSSLTLVAPAKLICHFYQLQFFPRNQWKSQTPTDVCFKFA